jgi:hypothetical protein
MFSGGHFEIQDGGHVFQGKKCGSTAEKVCNGHMYMCAKFHACFQKCTNILLSHWTTMGGGRVEGVTVDIIFFISDQRSIDSACMYSTNINIGVDTTYIYNCLCHSPTHLDNTYTVVSRI